MSMMKLENPEIVQTVINQVMLLNETPHSLHALTKKFHMQMVI